MKTPYRDWPIMDIVNRIRREWDNEQAAEQVLGLYEEANSWHKTSENLSRGCAELQSKLASCEKELAEAREDIGILDTSVDQQILEYRAECENSGRKDVLLQELQSRLGSVLGLFGLKPGDISDEQFAEDTQQLLNEAGAFEKIRTAYCRFQDDGHDERFFEALSDVLDEHGLTPNPCPMCNKYGPHGHTI